MGWHNLDGKCPIPFASCLQTLDAKASRSVCWLAPEPTRSPKKKDCGAKCCPNSCLVPWYLCPSHKWKGRHGHTKSWEHMNNIQGDAHRGRYSATWTHAVPLAAPVRPALSRGLTCARLLEVWTIPDRYIVSLARGSKRFE